MLDLEIFSGEIYHLPVFIPSCQVACPVDSFRIRMVQRILYKHFRCLFRGIVIAVCKARPSHTDLADGTLASHQPVLFIQQKDIHIGAGQSDRKGVRRFKFPVDFIQRAGICHLCRAVQIHVSCARIFFHPFVQILDRHHFPAKKDTF